MNKLWQEVEVKFIPGTYSYAWDHGGIVRSQHIQLILNGKVIASNSDEAVPFITKEDIKTILTAVNNNKPVEVQMVDKDNVMITEYIPYGFNAANYDIVIIKP